MKQHQNKNQKLPDIYITIYKIVSCSSILRGLLKKSNNFCFKKEKKVKNIGTIAPLNFNKLM